ncbi:MAG TPA: GxxExxY protein [Ignavibacteria bacterium]|nr:GxxExxY protein [Ignavibacteria bacterium]
MFTDEYKNECNLLSNKIIGLAIEVHKELGAGLLESIYEECMCFELSKAGIKFQRQNPLQIKYKGNLLDNVLRTDLIISDSVVVEIKAVESLSNLHKSQLKTYLKLTNKWLGLLVNFNCPFLDKENIKRVVLG